MKGSYLFSSQKCLDFILLNIAFRPTKMAAVGRVGSFGSCPPGLTATYTGGPLANELASGNGGAAAGDDEDGQNLWSCILSEVSTRSRSKLPAGKNVLLLGEDGAGKTSLIRKIQGIEEYKKGRGLEYLYLNVHDEDRDGECRLLVINFPDVFLQVVLLSI